MQQTLTLNEQSCGEETQSVHTMLQRIKRKLMGKRRSSRTEQQHVKYRRTFVLTKTSLWQKIRPHTR